MEKGRSFPLSPSHRPRCGFPARPVPGPGAPARRGGVPAWPPPTTRLPSHAAWLPPPARSPAPTRLLPPPPRRGGPRARPRAPCPPSSRPWRGRPPAQPRCLRSALGPGAAPPSARGASARCVRGTAPACAQLIHGASARPCTRVLAWCAQCFGGSPCPWCDA
jgi:hypothetical protein